MFFPMFQKFRFFDSILNFQFMIDFPNVRYFKFYIFDFSILQIFYVQFFDFTKFLNMRFFNFTLLPFFVFTNDFPNCIFFQTCIFFKFYICQIQDFPNFRFLNVYIFLKFCIFSNLRFFIFSSSIFRFNIVDLFFMLNDRSTPPPPPKLEI